MDSREFFDAGFLALTGRPPFAWQQRLFAEDFVRGTNPPALDIPTGLGKTSVIHVWLLALAWQAGESAVRLPRRLVYVVDRRTVVDQATDIAEKIRETLADAVKGSAAWTVRDALAKLCIDPADKASPLAISTLRGEFADNKEWQADPARATIIVGTVDMIGSRLLFSGYGVSRKMRPFHAGLLGQDSLIVHDEAHLSPAFGKLIKGIAAFQRKDSEPRRIRVLELSATQRDEGDAERPFILTAEDYANETVKRRLDARKTLILHDLSDPTKLGDELVRCALLKGATPARVLVYVRSPDMARKVAVQIEASEGKGTSAVLTGTMRGYERDLMASANPENIADEILKRRAEVFRGFRADRDRLKPLPESEYLVATSAGEVGIDLDADHMVSDLTELDSMIQRFGRVNRLGEGAAGIDVIVAPPPKDDAEATDRDTRIKATRDALALLPALADGGHDASPRALKALAERLDREKTEDGKMRLEACFSRTPRMVELTDVLLDGWAMTSVETLPGRPKIERWLHGIAFETPSTYVAWREEVDEFTAIDPPDRAAAIKKFFDGHPILARERLRGNRGDVVEELKTIARRLGDRDVVLLPARGNPVVEPLAGLLKKENEDQLRDATIVLPPDAGGLDEQGMLDGGVKKSVPDVADVPVVRAGKERDGKAASSRRERMRVLVFWDSEAETGMARVLGSADTLPAEGKSFRGFVSTIRKNDRLRSMREKERVILKRDVESGEPIKALLLLARRGSIDAAENSQEAAGRQPVELDRHNEDVRQEAERIIERLRFDPADALIGKAVVLAAERHDWGKDRPGWQKAIGHPARRGDMGDWKPWAKSDQRGFDDSACGRYRHEFGSMRQATTDPTMASNAERDLILHLIAAHHGWSRPHFDEDRWDIADDLAYGENETVAADAMRRFASLQGRFGHWRLAWLEALLRSADYRVSSGAVSERQDGEEVKP